MPGSTRAAAASRRSGAPPSPAVLVLALPVALLLTALFAPSSSGPSPALGFAPSSMAPLREILVVANRTCSFAGFRVDEGREKKRGSPGRERKSRRVSTRSSNKDGKGRVRKLTALTSFPGAASKPKGRDKQ